MAIRTTFGRIIEMTRHEARLSTNTSRGVDHLEAIKHVINRNYAMLADRFEWQHLKIKREDASKTLTPGQRYYDFPESIDDRTIECAWVKWGATWRPVSYGIDYADFNIQDSDTNQQSDPVLKWDRYNVTQFEVWPVPATTSTIGFDGKIKVMPMVSNGDIALLDDHMIALFAAAELTTGDKMRKEQLSGMAAERLSRCRAQMADHTVVRMGMNETGVRYGPREIKYIR